MNASSGTATAIDLGRKQSLNFRVAPLVALPLVFPFVFGPSINALQLLASWVCVAILARVNATLACSKQLLSWFAVAAAVVVLDQRPGSSLSLITVCAIMASYMAARFGAGIMRSGPSAQRALATGLLVAALVSVLLGLIQYYGLAESLVPWTTDPGAGQAYGNLRQRNQFASLLNLGVVAALWMHSGLAAKARRWTLGSIVLLTIGLAASTSRTGLLELVLIVGFAVFMARRERLAAHELRDSPAFRLPPTVFLLALIPFYFVAAWLLPHLVSAPVEGMLGRLREGAPVGHSRLILWHNVLTLIAERPWTGWGWGELSYAHYTTLYNGPRFVEILDNAHNLPLHLAVELGIPAAVLICGGFIWMVISAKPWSERNPARLMAWGLLGVIVVHSLVEYPLWYGPFQLVFGVCLGMLWPAAPRYGNAQQASSPPWWRRWLGAAQKWMPAALIAIVVYAGCDYIRISQIYLPREERLQAYEDNTLEKLQGSWLFADQVQFAELTLTTVTPANAHRMHELAARLLHFSPEPRVIVKLIESAEMLGLDDEARAQAERFRIAFPADYAVWLAGGASTDPRP
ncbi:Wzy polymerase domain-containing protein [Hydrogenophaga sp.]|uniref:PglL family O-oligosaccharyltransferase n=1 Tax=Hydrogenophaga sp. TaxID=1904254 RepID=UPI002721A725|nr:Wzy polymerase domain-containing protein [Hydrogenophaga sp.]MDO9439240.1 Wzy polymerase domain-containing protein [Hydrogenophaga sp.]